MKYQALFVTINGMRSELFAAPLESRKNLFWILAVFNLVNDMLLTVKGTFYRVYADGALLDMDVTRWDAAGLQDDVTVLYDWSV